MVKKASPVAGPGNYTYWGGSWNPMNWGRQAKTVETQERKHSVREEDDETAYVMLASVTGTASVPETTVVPHEDSQRDTSPVIASVVVGTPVVAEVVVSEEIPLPQPSSSETLGNVVHDDAQTLTAALETLAITTPVKKSKKKKNITLSGFEEREPLGYAVLENGRRMPVYDELAYVIKRGKKSSRRKQATLSGRDFLERVRLNTAKKWTILTVKQDKTVLYGN
jgi:hypothetical protein